MAFSINKKKTTFVKINQEAQLGKNLRKAKEENEVNFKCNILLQKPHKLLYQGEKCYHRDISAHII